MGDKLAHRLMPKFQCYSGWALCRVRVGPHTTISGLTLRSVLRDHSLLCAGQSFLVGFRESDDCGLDFMFSLFQVLTIDSQKQPLLFLLPLFFWSPKGILLNLKTFSVCIYIYTQRDFQFGLDWVLAHTRLCKGLVSCSLFRNHCIWWQESIQISHVQSNLPTLCTITSLKQSRVYCAVTLDLSSSWGQNHCFVLPLINLPKIDNEK